MFEGNYLHMPVTIYYGEPMHGSYIYSIFYKLVGINIKTLSGKTLQKHHLQKTVHTKVKIV